MISTELLKNFNIEDFLKSENNENGSNSEKVYFFILKEIFRNTFKVGSRITEAQIVETLKISNGPVRDALARLRNDGWIKTIPNMGSIIIDYREPNRFRKLYRDRRIIEIGCVVELAQTATYRQLAKLEEAIEDIDASLESENGSLYRDADLRFHYEIVEPIASPRLFSLWLHSTLQLFCVVFPGSETEFLRFGIDANPALADASHRKVFEAIATHNDTLARTLMLKHLQCLTIPK